MARHGTPARKLDMSLFSGHRSMSRLLVWISNNPWEGVILDLTMFKFNWSTRPKAWLSFTHQLHRHYSIQNTSGTSRGACWALSLNANFFRSRKEQFFSLKFKHRICEIFVGTFILIPSVTINKMNIKKRKSV